MNTRIQFLTVSQILVLPASVLTVKNILFPVNSSEPANTTSVRAMPKDVPIISGWKGDLAAASGAPREKIRIIPMPT
ncbi:hypothetical protein D3C76_1685160 [compost metagenome]